jgi:hypothetical protein
MDNIEELVKRIDALEKEVAMLKSMPGPIAIKTVKIEYTDLQGQIAYVHEDLRMIRDYLNKAVKPTLDVLVQKYLDESRSGGEASSAPLSEPP